MNLATKIRYGLSRLLVKGAAFPIVSPWIRATFFEPTFSALTEEGYRKNAVVFSCISALSFAFPEPPLTVYEDDSDDAAPLDKHPLRLLLRRPNPRMSERKLAVRVATYLALGGNCYLHKVRNGRGVPIELWPYHTGQIRPVPGGDTWIKEYEFYDSSAAPVAIPVEDIIHLQWPTVDPLQPWMAQAPLVAAAREVDADNEATRYMKAMLDNDAVPRGVLTLPPEETPDDSDIRRMKARWHDSYGKDRRGEIAVLYGGASYQRISLNMEELAFDALHAIPEARICAAMRVPPVIAGLGDDPTYANSEQAYYRWTRSTLVPLWSIVADEIQSGLADDFGNDVAVRYDLNRVQALQEDVDAKWTRVIAAYNAGILADEDEARGLINLPALTSQQRQQLISVAKPAQPALPAPEPPTAPPEPPVVPELPKQRKTAQKAAQRAGRALQRIRLRVAKDMEKALDGYFGNLADTIVARAGKAKAALPTVEQLLLASDGLALRDLVSRYYIEVLSASWETWNTAIGVEIAFDLEDPAVAATLKTAAQRVKLITETTRTAVQELLAYGAEQGWTADQLVRGADDRTGLRGLIEETYKGRARAISRTELGEAQQRAAVLRYDAAGATGVLVLDNGTEDSDPECTRLNGTTQSLKWAAANALQHPNCVRAFAPVFSDEE